MDTFEIKIRWKRAAARRCTLASSALQRHFDLLALHCLHLTCARARKVHDAAASFAHSIVVRACSLLSSAKAAQPLRLTTSAERRCKYSRSPCISIDALESSLLIRKDSVQQGRKPTTNERTALPSAVSVSDAAPAAACSAAMACDVAHRSQRAAVARSRASAPRTRRVALKSCRRDVAAIAARTCARRREAQSRRASSSQARRRQGSAHKAS